jgi:hypothetical protein
MIATSVTDADGSAVWISEENSIYTSKPVVWADSQIIILSLWSTDINKDESLGGDMTENATLIEKIQHVE